jgi:hypothetical protein
MSSWDRSRGLTPVWRGSERRLLLIGHTEVTLAEARPAPQWQRPVWIRVYPAPGPPSHM